MLDELQQLHPPLWVAIVLALVALALVANDMVLGQADYRRFATAMAAAEPHDAPLVRARFLWKWAWQPWVLTAITLAIVALAPGLTLGDLGLTWPDLSAIGALIAGGGPAGGSVAGVLAGVALVVIVGIVAAVVSARRKAKQTRPDEDVPDTPVSTVNAQVDLMLPTQREDRRAWIALSATAGVTEEIMYRGLMLLALAILLPTAPSLLIYALAVAAFAAAHAYQGWVGILSTGLLGAIFVALYVATGSVLPGMLLHALADARGALIKRGG